MRKNSVYRLSPFLDASPPLPLASGTRFPPHPPAARPSLRATLRNATEADHVAIDRTLSPLDLADPAAYRRFLHIQLAALTALSDPWGPNDRQDLEGLIEDLCADLAVERRPHAPAHDAIATGGLFHEAGIAYVVRGSRLGAAVLLQRVHPGLPTRYLAHRPALSWSQFLARLTALDEVADDEAIGQCVASARSAFGAFRRAASAASLA